MVRFVALVVEVELAAAQAIASEELGAAEPRRLGVGEAVSFVLMEALKVLARACAELRIERTL